MSTAYSAIIAFVTSTNGFIITCVSLVLWVTVFAWQFRLRRITHVIRSVPAEHRAALLAREYDIIPKEGLTADEWIRHKRNGHIFWAFVIFIGMATAVLTIYRPQEALSETLTAEWQERIRIYELKLKNPKDLSPAEISEIIAAIQVLSDKLNNVPAATRDYLKVASDASKVLDNGSVQMNSNDLEEAKSALERGAMKVAKKRFAGAAEDHLATAAEASYQAGNIALTEGSLQEAESFYRKAYNLVPIEPRYIGAYFSIAYRLSNYILSEALLGELEHAYAARNQLNDLLQFDLDMSRASLLLSQDRLRDGEALFVSLLERVDSNSNSSEDTRAKLYNNLGALYVSWGRLAEAKALIEKAISLFVRIDANGVNLSSSLNTGALADSLLGNYAEVKGSLDESERIVVNLYGPTTYRLIPILNNKARYLLAVEDAKGAFQILDEAEKISEIHYKGVHPFAARIFDLRAEIFLKEKNYAEACRNADAALHIKAKIFGGEDLETAHSLDLRGRCLSGAAKFKEANAAVEDGLKIVENLIGRDNLPYGDLLLTGGMNLLADGKRVDAAAKLSEAFQIMKKTLGLSHSKTKLSGYLLEQTKSPD